MRAQQKLFDRYTRNLKPGRLEWIGLRTVHKGAIEQPESVMAIADRGLEGDHRCTKTPGSARQVSIISREHIGVIEQLLGREAIDPAWLRRNLVVSGINLHALRHQKFQIGDAIFEGTAQCHPCKRMNEVLGPGALAAMLGHGGLCARIVQSGEVRLGDAVVKLDAHEEQLDMGF